MHGYENSTIRNAECQRIGALNGGVKKIPESPLDCMIKSVNAKGNQP